MDYARQGGLRGMQHLTQFYPYLWRPGIKCHPSKCQQLYPDGNNWNQDSETGAAATGLSHTFGSFEHMVVFACKAAS